MCAPKLKHMASLVPAIAPLWMREACGNAVFCKVNTDEIFDTFDWVLPVFYEHQHLHFMGASGNWYMTAEPVTDKETLDETEALRCQP